MILIPGFLFCRIWDIPIDFLRKNEIHGVILDIDNTLTFDHAPELPDRTAQWLEKIEQAGIKAAIVSNNREARVKPFAERCGLSYVADALKPKRVGFERSCAVLGERAENIAVIGDQLFTDILFGNRFGCTTILVEPMGPDLPWYVKAKRVLEKPFMPYIHRKKKYHAE